MTWYLNNTIPLYTQCRYCSIDVFWCCLSFMTLLYGTLSVHFSYHNLYLLPSNFFVSLYNLVALQNHILKSISLNGNSILVSHPNVMNIDKVICHSDIPSATLCPLGTREQTGRRDSLRPQEHQLMHCLSLPTVNHTRVSMRPRSC